jgi:rhodanese-related sulfurtransferase
MSIKGPHTLDLCPERCGGPRFFNQSCTFVLNRRWVLLWSVRSGLKGMMTSQIILYASILLVGVMYVRRRLQLKGLKTYSAQEVAERMKQLSSPVLLDVRTYAEREQKSIKGSLHIPLHELGHRVKELEKHRNKEIICYCQSGNRSASAASRLRNFGFTVANMKGGISEWNFSGLK